MQQNAKVLLKWSNFWDTKIFTNSKKLQSHNNYFNFQRIVLNKIKTISKGCMFYATHNTNLGMTNIQKNKGVHLLQDSEWSMVAGGGPHSDRASEVMFSWYCFVSLLNCPEPDYHTAVQFCKTLWLER